jgi:hypothetical protein
MTQLTQEMHGINLVIETTETTYIGRFDSNNGFQVAMHDCSVHAFVSDDETEAFVKQTAKYGVAVDKKDIAFDTAGVKRVRVLGDISQD